MIKWTVKKTTKNVKRAVVNLMNIHNWGNAIKHVNNESMKEGIVKIRLEHLEAEQTYQITRSR